jgi:hypothetical protein
MIHKLVQSFEILVLNSISVCGMITINSNSLMSTMPAAQYLSPIPNSKSVSQQSNIIVRFGPKLDRSITANSSIFSVQGSKSGHIDGRLVLSDDERTLIFLPGKYFLPGETITISVNNGIHSLSGQELDPFHFDFTVSPQTELERKTLNLKMMELYDPYLQPTGMRQNNGSAPLLEKVGFNTPPSSMPIPAVKTFNNPAPGSIFLSPWKIALTQTGGTYIPSDSQFILVVDGNNQPTFYKPTPSPAFDFKMLPNGKLVYFDGGSKKHYILDDTYALIDSFTCGNGYVTDPHDVRLMPNGHFLLLGLDPQTVDMTGIVTGGRLNATVIEFVIQELDLEKNVVFQWRSMDHFQITDATHEDLTAETIDYTHPNALDIDADSTILLSDRHMDEITKIDRATGNIIWRWGGKNNQFTFVNDTLGFSHQHSINHTDNGNYTLFDNGNFHVPKFSRAVEYKIDGQMKTATLLWQFRHTPDIYTFAMGSVERLSNGNTFIGWGASTLAATEVRPDGSTAYEIQFPDSIISYRAFKYQWNALTVGTNHDQIPYDFILDQNYPNPFNPTTMISYQLPATNRVTLNVYDILGRKVTTLVNEVQQAGNYKVVFDGSGLSSGIYFSRVEWNGKQQLRKMVLLK